MSTIKNAAGIMFLLVIGLGMLTNFPAANQMIQKVTRNWAQTDLALPVIASSLTQELDEYRQQATAVSTTNNEAQNIQDPAQRHLELKQLMLNLTNQRRAEAGVPLVRLGQNPAAQLHAQAALQGCYSAHWDQWGMKPNHRYTLTGGTGAGGENVAGSSYCIQPGDNYAPNGPMETEVAEIVQGWFDSPGHRINLLNPAHTIMNAGIAYDRFNQVMAQHFTNGYIHYQTRPEISPGGTLGLSGRISGATLEIGDSVNITISYDPPPQPLTQGQLANTYSLCNPRPVGYLVKPLPADWHYDDADVRTQTQEFPCVDPHRTSPDHPAPRNPEEAHQAWAWAKEASANGSTITVETMRITAEQFDISSSEFNFRAGITQILNQNGPGIYTVTMWGRPLHMSESAPLSEQSIFWQTQPEEGHPYPITEPGDRLLAETQTPAALPRIAAPTPPPSTKQAPAPTPVQIPVQAPAPTRIPARMPTPAPTPTPTPIPPNIHRGAVDQYSYSMEFPRGWTTALNRSGHAILLSPDGTRGAEIRIRRMGEGGTAGLVEARSKELLARMRDTARGGGDRFEMKPNRPPPAAVTNQLSQAAQMEYRWRESSEQCLQDVVEVISPSNWFTHSVLINAWVCEDNLDEAAETQRQEALASFTGRTNR